MSKKTSLDLSDILKDSIRKFKSDQATDGKKALNILEYAETLLGERLSFAQKIICKLFYAGSRFNEDLRVTEEEIEVMQRWDIEQTWLFEGETSKLDLYKKFVNEELREKKLEIRREMLRKLDLGLDISEEQEKQDGEDPLWFNELILVLGRRSGKSYLTALLCSYEAYKLIMLGDPKKFYGINSDIAILNTAVKEDQAEKIIFREIKKFIRKCPVFDGRIGKFGAKEIRILTDVDLEYNKKLQDGEKPEEGSILILCGSSSSGGLRGHTPICLDGETIVESEGGNFRIKDIYGKEYSKSGNKEKEIKLKGINGYHQTTHVTKRLSDIYEVHFHNGNILDCTIDHKLFVVNFEDGMKIKEKPLKEIEKNDLVAIKDYKDWDIEDYFYFDVEENIKTLPHYNHVETKEVCKECGFEFGQITHAHLKSHKMSFADYIEKHGNTNSDFYKNRMRNSSVKIPEKCDEDLSFILGAIISEGNYTIDNRIQFSTTDEDFAELYISKVKSCFNIDVRKRIVKKEKDKDVYICTFSNDLVKTFLLKIVGLESVKSECKKIPNCILKSPISIVSVFLKSLFEGDGIQKKKCIQYGTKSKRLSQDVYFILSKLGFSPKIYKEKIKNGTFYKVDMGQHSSSLFLKEIGFYSERRKKYKSEYESKYTKVFCTKISKKLFQEIEILCKDKKIFFKGKANLQSFVRSYRSGRQEKILRKNILLLNEFLEKFSDESKKEIDFLTKHKLVNIKSIEKIKNEEVYDVSFMNSEDKSFYAENILNHNCIIYDELAHFVNSDGKSSAKEVYNALSRSSATFKMWGDGRQIVLSSPYDASGFFYDLYNKSKTVRSMLMFQIPTWNANPRVPKSELQHEFEMDPEYASVEYGAQFKKKKSLTYFPHDKIEQAMYQRPDWIMHQNGTPGYEYYLHIDAADTSDRYAFMVIHVERRYDPEIREIVEYWVEDYSYFMCMKKNKGVAIDPDHIVDTYILPLFKKFNIMCVSFDGVLSREQRKKIAMKCPLMKEIRFAGRQKNNIYDNTRNKMMSGRIELCMDDVELAGELRCVKIDHGKTPPKIDKDAESKFPYDDLVDCLCGAIYAANKGSDGETRLPRIGITRTGRR